MVALQRGFKTLAVIRTVVLSAAGSHFCAASSSAPQEPRHGPLLARRQQPSARGAWKPVLAAVHGACVGGGVKVVAACAIVEKSRRRWEEESMWGPLLASDF
uniref:Secreted protein n=1 Tax=Oryza nivara TaxID=4536 RepID=A0A0E0FLM2_ORYNI